MSYYTIFSTIFQYKNMNNEKIPEQHRTQVLFGDFSILAQSSIVISVPSFKKNTNRSSL